MSTIQDYLFNRKLFYTLCSTFVLIVFVLLVYGACFSQNTPPKVIDIVEYPMNRPIVNFPLDIYVSDDFSPHQVNILQKAVNDWNRKTNGFIKINLISENSCYNKDLVSFVDFYSTYNLKTVWKKKGLEKDIEELIVSHGFFDGVQKGSMIIIIDVFDNISDFKLELVFKHELGHLMGLQHLKQEYMGLMYAGGNDGIITNYDLMQFNYLYKK